MSVKRFRTRYIGVFCYESTDPKRTYNGRQDRAFTICWSELGKKRWKTIGWASEGVSAQLASNERIAIISKGKQGGLACQRLFDSTRFHDVASAYFEDRKVRGAYSANDESRYRKHIFPYFQYRKISEIDSHITGEFKRRILSTVAAPASQKKIFALIRAIINFALREHLWEGTNYFSRNGGFQMPYEDNKSERFLTPEEADRLLEELSKVSVKLHDMALLSLSTGLRATEILGIKANDLNFTTNHIWINQKGRKRGSVKVPAEVMERLKLYPCQGDELLFPSRKGTRQSKISASFDRVTKLIGLNNADTPRHKKVIFHTLRHTFASWLAQREDVSMQEIQHLMRHESIQMTDRYSHLKPGSGWEKAQTVFTTLKSVHRDKN